MCSAIVAGGGGERQWGSGVGGRQRVSHCLEVLQVRFNLSLLLTLSYIKKCGTCYQKILLSVIVSTEVLLDNLHFCLIGICLCVEKAAEPRKLNDDESFSSLGMILKEMLALA